MVGILINAETGDVLCENGTVSIGDTEGQVVADVLTTMRGEWKEYPLIGGEIRKQLSGGIDVMWPGEVKKMLRACGVECESVTITDGVVTVK